MPNSSYRMVASPRRKVAILKEENIFSDYLWRTGGSKTTISPLIASRIASSRQSSYGVIVEKKRRKSRTKK